MTPTRDEVSIISARKRLALPRASTDRIRRSVLAPVLKSAGGFLVAFAALAGAILRTLGNAFATLCTTKLVPCAVTVRRRLDRIWRNAIGPALAATGTALAAVLARRVLPVLRGVHRLVLRPAGRRLAPVFRAAGRRLLAALPDGTVPALRAALDRARTLFDHTIAPRAARVLRPVGDALGRVVPAGVRRRMPRGRALTAGLVVAALVAAAPISIAAASGGSAGSGGPARVSGSTSPVGPASGGPAPAPPGQPPAAVPPGAPTGPTQAPAAPPPPVSAPAPAPPVPAGVSSEQVQNATAIAEVAVQHGLDEHAVTVALATSLQESGLVNLNYGDRDSLGLFQQRPSAGWGTPQQIMDPHYAAGRFFQALARVPGWENLPVTVAAQIVQQSAFPDAYAKWQALADGLAQAVVPSAVAAVK
ncbi:MAG TPA: hypothetical protein VFX70_18290 [Mycobacteriales bacterium]|nr:hypothetical protein [Mycobacteriales bacterium]